MLSKNRKLSISRCVVVQYIFRGFHKHVQQIGDSSSNDFSETAEFSDMKDEMNNLSDRLPSHLRTSFYSLAISYHMDS